MVHFLVSFVRRFRDVLKSSIYVIEILRKCGRTHIVTYVFSTLVQV
jgi:hypothetical protein